MKKLLSCQPDRFAEDLERLFLKSDKSMSFRWLFPECWRVLNLIMRSIGSLIKMEYSHS